MAGVIDFVRVAVDQAGKRILNLKHVALLSGEDAYQQITGICDPDDPTKLGKVATGLPGAADAGQVVRQAPHNYDSGLITLGSSIAVVTAGVTKVEAIGLCNLTASTQPVSVTDTAGTKFILKNFPLQPGNAITIPQYGRPMTGIKAGALNAGSVDFQVWGNQ